MAKVIVKAWEKVMGEVLLEIKPSLKVREEFERMSSRFVGMLSGVVRGAEVVLGGSGAKDTWLAQMHDADVYVVFDRKKYQNKLGDISNVVEGWLSVAFSGRKVERVHGSRDYFAVWFEGVCFEVVPIIGIKDAGEAENITDISPLHSEWVNRKAAKYKDDIRLAKQLCKAQGFYGAESHIGGFSGYVLEILVVYYKGFEGLVRAAAKWRRPEIVDVEGYYPKYPKKKVFLELNRSKLQSPLIVVDPVDKSRNAAAALGERAFDEMVRVARRLLRNPSRAFFRPVMFDIEKLRVDGKELSKKAASWREAGREVMAGRKKIVRVIVEVVMAEGREDVAGAKVLKALRGVVRELESFGVVDSGCWFGSWDIDVGSRDADHSKGMRKGKGEKKEGVGWGAGKCVMWLMLLSRRLPEFYVRRGPPSELEESVRKFRDEHGDGGFRKGDLRRGMVFEKEGRWFAKVKYEERDLGKALDRVIRSRDVAGRISRVVSVKIS